MHRARRNPSKNLFTTLLLYRPMKGKPVDLQTDRSSKLISQRAQSNQMIICFEAFNVQP